jgi:hypothetical protein
MAADREDLVELGHSPPNGRTFLDEVHLHTHVCEVDRSLNTSNSATYDDALRAIPDFRFHTETPPPVQDWRFLQSLSSR